ncbi:unnamed protein product [Phytophthora fragariaefolia]|uniref:Unnamed protein product n=1 Tax=Phytophthora fragariaefolia TaxID=1490495 RepID=A0A9W6XDY0_9STRA|nr:unnamed protein product [Phytophthora fragariaefolia]
MGKVSTAQVPPHGPENASREIFQGLFKDLGKQAMALEAILRAVCGRVDKMESWLTEVSFGMTELDLKLRNIAHNIDGTAAVDDEAQGPHRWAIPPPDDEKPLAPTVSKKLGADKKAVRVTGMAAAILDRLAATTANTATAVEVDKVEKAGVKKKSKDKKHGAKKVKLSCLPEVPISSLIATTEAAPLPLIQPPPPVVGTEHVVASEEHPVIEPLTIQEQYGEQQCAPVQSESGPLQKLDVEEVKAVDLDLVASIDELPAALQQTNTATNKNTGVVEVHGGLSARSEQLAEPVLLSPEESAKKPIAPMPAPNVVIAPSEDSLSESSPATSPKEINPLYTQEQTPAPNVQDHHDKIAPTDTQQNGTAVLNNNDMEAQESSSLSRPVVASASSSVEYQSSTPVVTREEKIIEERPSAMISALKSTTPTVKPVDTTPVITSSISSILPTVTDEKSVEAFVLKGSANTSLAPARPHSGSAGPVASISEPEPTTAAADVIKIQVNQVSDTTLDPTTTPPSASELKRPAASQSATATTKVMKTSESPMPIVVSTPPVSPKASDATETVIDPLLPHRTTGTARRRSSQMAPRSSLTKKNEHGIDTDSSRYSIGNKRGSDLKRISIAPPAQLQEQQQQAIDPTQQLAPQPPSSLPPTTKRAEIHEESDESDSDSSSEASGTSSEDDAEAGAAVEEISNTMTALRKLKRAQMLSPEEETELKERAHKKWFQLKGHIKEKQKKDVTNILLKRKKNVFTVSSRIELLEEKSREIFAALKQLTNEMRDKSDRTTHETLRRRIADIEHSLQSIDSRIASLSAPAIEKVGDLEVEVSSLRTTVLLQLTTAQSEAAARHSLLEGALATQRTLVESLTRDVSAQLRAQTEHFDEKFNQQPDYSGAIENLRRGLKRKADLKLLKELEARLLGMDAENDDCLVRCLSCRKEVTNPYSEKEIDIDEGIGSTGSGATQLRKINPGPTSSRIYRSNIPFSAQPLVQEGILEEASDESFIQSQQALLQPLLQSTVTLEPQLNQQLQSAGDCHASEKAPVVRVPSVKWSTPPDTSLKREPKSSQPSPLSLVNITATRAILSPGRPISAPVVPMKKKPNAVVKSKSVLKSLSLPVNPPKKD